MPSFFKYATLFSFLIAAPLQAQSLLDAFNQAKQNDRNYQSMLAQHRATLEKKPQAYSYLYPNISGNITRTDTSYNSASEEDSENTTTSITLAQPLYNKATLHGINQVQKTIDTSTLNLAQSQKQLILDVVDAYFNVLQSQESVAVIQNEVESIEQQLTNIRQKFNIGLTSINDLNDAKTKKDIAQSNLLVTETNLIIAKEKLGLITHQDANGLLPLKSTIPLFKPDPNDVNWWINTAYKKNIAIKLKKIALESSQESINIQRAGHYPTLNLTATLSDVKSNKTQTTTGQNSSIGLQLNIPIFSGGAVNSKVREARHNYDVIKINLDQQKRNTKSLVRELFFTVISNIRQIKATEQSLKSAQVAYDTEVISFEAGVRTSTDVLNARSQLSNTELSLVKLKYSYLSNTLKLKQSAGILSHKDLKDIDKLLIRF